MIKTNRKHTTRELSEKKQSSNNNQQLKKEVLDVFKKFGYLADVKDHEVTFRTTSGNIAWININSIETIK